MESFNIIYFGSKPNSKIIISLDTYTTQKLKQLLWKIVSTITITLLVVQTRNMENLHISNWKYLSGKEY